MRMSFQCRREVDAHGAISFPLIILITLFKVIASGAGDAIGWLARVAHLRIRGKSSAAARVQLNIRLSFQYAS